MWIKGKSEESKFYRNRAMNKSVPEKYVEAIPTTFEGTAPPSTLGASPRREDWRVNENGQAFHPQDEPISFVEPEVEPEPPFEHGADFLTDERINRLLKGGKISLPDAESIRRQTKNMNFLQRESFLSAIEHRRTKRQERDRSSESIAKRYGIFGNRFGL